MEYDGANPSRSIYPDNKKEATPCDPGSRIPIFLELIPEKIEALPIMVTDCEQIIIDAASQPELSGGIIQLAQVL